MQRQKLRFITISMLVALLLSLTFVASAQDTIELNMTWWGSQSRHDRTIAVIEAYEAANPGIDIIYEFANFTDYWTKVNTQAAGGQLACLMQQDYAYLTEWANRELLLPLNAYYEDCTIYVS